MSASEASVSLTPSEQALIYADRFAPKGSMLKGKENLLLGEGNVAVNPLAEVMLCLALLGLEKAGTVKLQQATRKSLFGLIKRHVIEVTPTGGAMPYPEGSLEALLARNLTSAPVDFGDLVYAFFQDDMKWPHQFILDVAKAALGDRGVLQLESTKKMLVFTTVKATVAEDRKAALLAGTPAEAQALMKAAEGRGTFWTEMVKQASSGLLRRTERDVPDNTSFSD